MVSSPLRRRHSSALVFVTGWAAALTLAWAASPARTLPSPREVVTALSDLWWRGGLGPELFTTLKLVGVATLLTVLLSYSLALARLVAALAPLGTIVSKLRFLGLTGLVFPFTLATGGGFALKVALLTFGMTTFLATAFLRIVDEIPDAQVDYLRGLGASRGRLVWEVLVRGTLDRMLDAARQNIAMGWSMITMVEGIARSDGGVGAVLLAENKHFRLSEVYAILIVVLLVGLAIDFALGALERALCPHSHSHSRSRSSQTSAPAVGSEGHPEGVST